MMTIFSTRLLRWQKSLFAVKSMRCVDAARLWGLMSL
jgi:hypothetical protein